MTPGTAAGSTALGGVRKRLIIGRTADEVREPPQLLRLLFNDIPSILVVAQPTKTQLARMEELGKCWR